MEPAGGGATTASPEEVEDLAAAAASDDAAGRGIDFSMHRSSPSFILLLLIRRGESGSSERGLVRAAMREEVVETIEESALGGDARSNLMFFPL